MITADEPGIRTTRRPGGSRTVIFLHGFPQTSSCWDEVAPLVRAAGHLALTPDQRGYGSAARPTSVADYALDHLVADIVAMIDTIDAPVDLVGHDWGGIVAWTVAARHPTRVRSLTAVSAPHPSALAAAVRRDHDRRRRSAYLGLLRGDCSEQELLADGAARLRGIYSGSSMPTYRLERHVAQMADPVALTAALNWYRANPVQDGAHLPPVTVPTMYIRGTEDSVFGHSAAIRTADLVKARYTQVILSGAGHWLPDDRPADLAAHLVTHLGVHAE